MNNFEKPNIVIEDESEDLRFARFICEPLVRGYGTTLGNSLRRILLSTLKGYAVSQIKIDGVLHEFSTIDGIKEDVTEIIMNIKDLAIKNNATVYEEKIATIDYEGEGIIKASDIHVDPEIEITNKDLIIAHAAKNTKFHMDLVITPGIGYTPSEKNKANLKGVGYIAIDSICDPVERVNLKVENTRVGNQTDFDKLTLEIKTNGTISAKDSLSLAAQILSEHAKLFIDLSDVSNPTTILDIKDKKKDIEKKIDKGIGELELTVRSYNCLKRAGINTVSDLLKKTPEEVKNIRNLGNKSLEEIYQKLAEMGLQLNPNE